MKKKEKLLCYAMVISSISILGFSAISCSNDAYATSTFQGNVGNGSAVEAQKDKLHTQVKEKKQTKKKTEKHQNLRTLSVDSSADIAKIRTDISKEEKSEGMREKTDLMLPTAPSAAYQPVYVITPGTKLTLSGSIDVQYGGVSQEDNFKNMGSGVQQSSQVSGCTSGRCHTPQSGFVEDAKLKLLMSKTEKDLEYGLYFKLNANPGKQTDGYVGNDIAFGYLQNKYGRVEIGSNYGANSLMKVDAASIAVATGGIDGDYSDWIDGRGAYYSTTDQSNKTDLSDLFIKSPYMSYENMTSKKANKLTYISPLIGGFSVGLSFVPDTKVRGTNYNMRRVNDGTEYRNVTEGVLKYSYNADSFDKVGFEISLGTEFGKSLPYLYNDKNGAKNEMKTHKLNAYQIGGSMQYRGFTVVGSIGDSGKSGMLSDDLAQNVGKLVNGMKKQQKFFTTGLAYKNDKVGLSVTYLQSNSAGLIAVRQDSDKTPIFVGYCTGAASGQCKEATKENAGSTQKYNALSFGAQYEVMPGLLPYLEVTRFKLSSPFAQLNTNKGTIFILGTKVSF